MKRKARPEGLLWTQWKRTQTRFGEKIVVLDAATNASWTANALTDAADVWAAQLAPFSAGERIAFRLPNGAPWLALFLALQRAGLAAVPLDGGMPREGCLALARRLGARALYLDGEFHSLKKTRACQPKICCLKITSGSGSLPKAVECRAEHLLADGQNLIKTMGIRVGDRNLAVIPFGHSYGLGNLVMPLIMQGTAVVSASEYVPRQIIDWIERHGITLLPAVPALFRVLGALPSDGKKLTSLRTVISAGAMLGPEIAQAFFHRYGIEVHNFYGSSETGGICYDRTGSASLTGRSVGKPVAGVLVSIKAQKIMVTSKAVATRGGRWRLPDYGEWNGRGELVLLGRAGPGANIGGKKVHPLEVERALRSLRGVSDAAVWLAKNQGRDLLAAAVETVHSRAEIERALAAQLPEWKCPKFYFVARELPRNSRGKLDLAPLREKARQPD